MIAHNSIGDKSVRDTPAAVQSAPAVSGQLLVLGSTGLLGQAFVAEARARAQPCCGVARSGSDRDVDLSDAGALAALVLELRPATIVNCVAVTSLDVCEADPALAFCVNARIPALLAQLAGELGVRLVHVSTDHFFTGDGASPHVEDAEVKLVNEYARSKYAGERLALTNPTSLVVRTNIIGLRRWPDRPTFAEWALEAVRSDLPMVLFEDFFTSSINARTCAAAILDLVDVGATGLVNVASAQVSSKLEFMFALARELQLDLRHVRRGSVRELLPRRAESLGLDVTRAERLLDRKLPNLADTITAIVRESHDGDAHEI
jgi:dTDP-4-dehydrorhamnose reductase